MTQVNAPILLHSSALKLANFGVITKILSYVVGSKILGFVRGMNTSIQ